VEEETDEVKLVSAGGNVNKGKDTSKVRSPPPPHTLNHPPLTLHCLSSLLLPFFI
jgi:hypothetical protein